MRRTSIWLIVTLTIGLLMAPLTAQAPLAGPRARGIGLTKPVKPGDWARARRLE
jgi:hypothetical protein